MFEPDIMNRFKNLMIWSRSVELATKIYQVTHEFPNEEKFGLTSQMRRCAVSVGSNISEGAGRNTTIDFKRFLNIAYSSLYELETQLIISTKLELLNSETSKELCNEINELQKMIYSFSKGLD